MANYVPTFIYRVDAAPLDDDEFSFTFNSWVSNLVDTLNYSIETIEGNFNGISPALVAPTLTTAQLAAITTAPGITVFPPNGSIWYISDHSPPCLAAYVNGTVVQISTTAYP